MSAVPLPKQDPEPASQADAEGWALLEALRRRLDDQGAQGRKTQHQVTQLAESIGALVSEQRRRAKWANLNSFVAYLIFTLLVGTGFYMLYRSRANELVEARDSAQRERDQAVKRADDLHAKTTARDVADGRAWDVYQLLEAGKRSEAAGKLGSLAELPLSRTERAVLAARAHETQVMEVDAALKAAAASFKAGRYGDVVAPLEAALVSEPAGARASTMRYFLGVAYAKANQLEKATQFLSAAVAADVDQDDARFQLASALDRSGQYAKARTEYDRFATAHPQSQLAVFAMRRSATLARMPAAGPAVRTPPGPATKAIAPAMTTTPTAPATTPAAPATTPAAPATTPAAPAKQLPAPSATAPVKPPAKPAPKWGPAKPAAPKPAAPTPAPAPTEPPAVEPPASEAEPMSGGAKPSSPSITEPAPKTEIAPAQLPSLEIDRTPAPSPLGPPIDRAPAPSVPTVPRGEQAPPPTKLASADPPKPAKPAPAPPTREPPAKPAPAPPTPPPSEPKPPVHEPAPKFPSLPRNESLPSFPIERTPAPSPLGPPVEREPAPAPNAPPRGETPPPPTRF